MFNQAISFCPFRSGFLATQFLATRFLATQVQGRTEGARPGAASPLLVAATAILGLAALATMPALHPLPAEISATSGPRHGATLSAGRGASLESLRDAAEAERAALLAVPGVGEVRLQGLQTAGVDIYTAQSRLARLGISTADLEAALPVAHRQAGRLTVQNDAAQDGVQAIADTPVHAGQRVFRLGDIATVARAPLAQPISRITRDGQPAVDIMVVPAKGVSPAALDRRVASAIAQVAMPEHVTLK